MKNIKCGYKQSTFVLHCNFSSEISEYLLFILFIKILQLLQLLALHYVMSLGKRGQRKGASRPG